MDTLARLRAGELAGSSRLDLGCGLTEFPAEIFTLADSLEILNLSDNALSTLPDDLPRLHKLRVIFCSNNRFTALPEVLGRCAPLEMVGFKANQIREVAAIALPAKLRWLILTDNQIMELPAELGRCQYLQKLMLAGNQLQELPAQLADCRQLELLRIAANRFRQLPGWLWEHPRLAWLAYGGNACSQENEALAGHASPDIDWNRLKLQQVLGEGASGVIYHAQYLSDDGATPVAVKLFKGALTSDGLPQSEMRACAVAGQHDGLIPLCGVVSNHPEATPALVMELISPSFVSLAGPPSLESCTPDCYPAAARFTLAGVIAIALRMAAVAEHLHARGLMHGDLYAHNILLDAPGSALLGDFGAASFLPRQDMALAAAMQRIEVRAFSCLLQELLDRCEFPLAAAGQFESLRALQQRAAQVEVEARPLFDEIHAHLQSLAQD